jgi:hypothetical protein
VEKAFVLAGGEMCHRELSYVQMSRARGETLVFTDRESAGEGLTTLVRDMSRSRAKDLAHDVVWQSGPELGLRQQL